MLNLKAESCPCFPIFESGKPHKVPVKFAKPKWTYNASFQKYLDSKKWEADGHFGCLTCIWKGQVTAIASFKMVFCRLGTHSYSTEPCSQASMTSGSHRGRKEVLAWAFPLLAHPLAWIASHKAWELFPALRQHRQGLVSYGSQEHQFNECSLNWYIRHVSTVQGLQSSIVATEQPMNVKDLASNMDYVLQNCFTGLKSYCESQMDQWPKTGRKSVIDTCFKFGQCC